MRDEILIDKNGHVVVYIFAFCIQAIVYVKEENGPCVDRLDGTHVYEIYWYNERTGLIAMDPSSFLNSERKTEWL